MTRYDSDALKDGGMQSQEITSFDNKSSWFCIAEILKIIFIYF